MPGLLPARGRDLCHLWRLPFEGLGEGGAAEHTLVWPGGFAKRTTSLAWAATGMIRFWGHPAFLDTRYNRRDIPRPGPAIVSKWRFHWTRFRNRFLHLANWRLFRFGFEFQNRTFADRANRSLRDSLDSRKGEIMLLGYLRVSKGDDQSPAAQRLALSNAGCERFFEEAASGGKWDRPLSRSLK